MAREAWTDERLDDLNKKVDNGFGDMREEFRAVRGEAQAFRSEMAAMNRALIQTMVGGFLAMGAGFAGTIATILLAHG